MNGRGQRTKGKSEREVRNCLARAVARQLFRLLERQAGVPIKT